MDDIRTPELAQVIQRAIQQALGETYVSLPAEIQSYDSASQTASVQPQLRKDVTDADGNVISVSLPIISHVPILFPGGSGFRIMWPLGLGDTVTLVMSDRSMDIWQSFGGNVDPLDGRMHSINDAVAIPGLHPNNKPWSPDDTSVFTIGRDGGIADFVATAQRVLTELTNIKTAYDLHVHTSATAGSPTTPPTVPLPSPFAPASSSVKILG